MQNKEENIGFFVNSTGNPIAFENKKSKCRKAGNLATETGVNKKSRCDDFGVLPEGYIVYNWETETVVNENKTKKTKKTKHRSSLIKTSIGAKLILMISTIVLISALGITLMVSLLVSADTRTNAEANNLTINSRTASDCESRINSAISSASMLLDLLDRPSTNMSDSRTISSIFFERNKNIAAVYLPQSGRRFINQEYFISHEVEDSVLDDYILAEEDSFSIARSGASLLKNASSFFQTPVIALFYPLTSKLGDTEVLVIYSSEDLFNSFSSGNINSSIFVNSDGDILMSSDLDLLMEVQNIKNNPVVKAMLSSKLPNSQLPYTDSLDEEYLGAFCKINYGNNGVITVVKVAQILEGVRRTTVRNIYLTCAILSLSIIIVWFFSKSMSRPLKMLKAVSDEINQGNFNTDLFELLTTKRNDEIGVLIRSTKNERDILNTMTTLTNKGVTTAIIKKQIDFDAHLKDITIFFSDIRGFTAISDGFQKRFGEKSAVEIIGFLNDYMARMVNCIVITGGIVDKFEGDAIMACWGVLRDDSLDFEHLPDSDPEKLELYNEHKKHMEKDALDAIRAMIGMRYALMKYNKDALLFTKLHEKDPDAQYKPLIKIGSGLNSGRATVGFMGSNDKMEFTSIGDAVNFASRTEAANKASGTDMLLSQDTYNLLCKKYIRCQENNFVLESEYEPYEIVVERIPKSFEVKGKGKQFFYGVVNMPNFNIQEFFETTDPDFKVDSDCEVAVGPKGPKTLSEVRKLLGIPEPDLEKVDFNAEEEKIKIEKS